MSRAMVGLARRGAPLLPRLAARDHRGCDRRRLQPLGAFLRAALPLVEGGLAATAFFVFILNWSHLLIALVLTQDHARTATVFMQGLSTKAGSLFGPQAALAVILLVLPLVSARPSAAISCAG